MGFNCVARMIELSQTVLKSSYWDDQLQALCFTWGEIKVSMYKFMCIVPDYESFELCGFISFILYLSYRDNFNDDTPKLRMFPHMKPTEATKSISKTLANVSTLVPSLTGVTSKGLRYAACGMMYLNSDPKTCASRSGHSYHDDGETRSMLEYILVLSILCLRGGYILSKYPVANKEKVWIAPTLPVDLCDEENRKLHLLISSFLWLELRDKFFKSALFYPFVTRAFACFLMRLPEIENALGVNFGPLQRLKEICK